MGKVRSSKSCFTAAKGGLIWSCTSHAENRNDFYYFNLSTSEWRAIGQSENATFQGDSVPSARNSLGMTSAGSDLYIFGGKSNVSGVDKVISLQRGSLPDERTFFSVLWRSLQV